MAPLNPFAPPYNPFDHVPLVTVIHLYPYPTPFLQPLQYQGLGQWYHHLHPPVQCGELWGQQESFPLLLVGPQDHQEVVPNRVCGAKIVELKDNDHDDGGEKEGETEGNGFCGEQDGGRNWDSRGFGFPAARRRFGVRKNERRIPAEKVSGFVKQAVQTTVMIRNIPNKLSKEQLLELLDEHCRSENQNEAGSSSYDFIYLPMDFRSGNNLGYAFVNWTSEGGARALRRSFQGKDWASFQSHKVCEITSARIQGLEGLLDHFRNSIFVCHNKDFLPVRFFPSRNGSRRAKQQFIGRHIRFGRGGYMA